MPQAQFQQFKDYISQRQIERLWVVGSNEETAPIIDASYRRFLGAMEAHLANQPFMLGRRPVQVTLACSVSSVSWWALIPRRGRLPTPSRRARSAGSIVCRMAAA
jgi:hypothetical protein